MLDRESLKQGVIYVVPADRHVESLTTTFASERTAARGQATVLRDLLYSLVHAGAVG